MLLYKSNQKAHFGEVNFSMTYSLADGKGSLRHHSLIPGSWNFCKNLLEYVELEECEWGIWVVKNMAAWIHKVPSTPTQNHLDINLSKSCVAMWKAPFSVVNMLRLSVRSTTQCRTDTGVWFLHQIWHKSSINNSLSAYVFLYTREELHVKFFLFNFSLLKVKYLVTQALCYPQSMEYVKSVTQA